MTSEAERLILMVGGGVDMSAVKPLYSTVAGPRMNQIACYDVAIKVITHVGSPVDVMREPHRFRLRIGNAMVQVFSVRGGEWSVPDAYEPIAADTGAAVFVDYSTGEGNYYVIAGEDLRELTAAHEKKNRSEHGGTRPRNNRSTHMAIRPDAIEQWRDNWEILRA